jgi:hypothetical protein
VTALARFVNRKSLTLVRNGFTQEPDGFISFGFGTTAGDEEFDRNFLSYVEGIYKSSGPVFACVLARMLPFSEVRFQFQEIIEGRPGKLSNGPSLNLLDQPWPNGTTGELLARMEQDVSLSGNFYATVVNGHIRRLRPDLVRVLTGVPGETERHPLALNAEVLGYFYDPPGQDSVFLTAASVVHYSPLPDPAAQWRGMSWLTPVIREVCADQAGTRHKEKFFSNGAALSTVIRYDSTVPVENIRRYVSLFDEQHRGPENAYKTLHIGGGADVSVVGTAMTADFRAIQGAGETRIAAAAGVGAIMARFSEGLAGSALNQGNYNAAKRQFADMTLRPLWRIAAASLAKLVATPSNARLWYDDRDVQFLKEDRMDAANIMAVTAQTMNSLVTAGYTPDSVVTAVETGDMTRLVHSGMYSVQLQPIGAADLPKFTAADLLKLGARNSAGDQQLIQSAHDAITAVGATCVTP